MIVELGVGVGVGGLNCVGVTVGNGVSVGVKGVRKSGGGNGCGRGVSNWNR